MSQNFSKNIFEMAKDDYLNRVELVKVIRKYHRCKNESEKDALRDVVVKNNMRLVIKIAKGYAARSNQNPDDLFQNGIIGILVALDKFKPNKRFAFSTYAYYWIEQFIQRAVAEDKMINTHRYLSVGVGKTPVYFKSFAEADGNMDKFVTLLRARGVTRKEQDRIENVIAMNQDSSFIDIHGTIGSGESEIRMIDVLEDKNTIPPDVEAIDNIIRDKIMDCIRDELTPIEQQVIHELYFSEKRNVNDASKKIKKTKLHIAKAEQRAIKKIARVLRGEKAFAVDSFDHAWEQITNGDYREIFKKIVDEGNTDLKPVNELPLKNYVCSISPDNKNIYEIMAPTGRAAVNFLREKTGHYTDIKIYSVNGKPFEGITPSTFLRDFKKSERPRLLEEVSACRWR